MKTSTLVAAVGCLAVSSSATAEPSQPHNRAESSTSLRFLSYNVRYDAQPNSITVQETIDSLPQDLPPDPPKYYSGTAEQPWSTRRIHVANDILWPGVDVFGGQELLKRQVDDLQVLLGDGWSYVGVGRDDGKERGEYSAVFWQTSSVQLLEWDTFWLSATPFEVSKYSGAGSIRICTTVRFAGPTGNFTFLNTHLDNVSAGQRSLGASLILRRAKYEAIKTRRPVIVTGDFNSPTTDGAYKIMVGQQEPDTLNQAFTDRYSWTPAEEEGFENFATRDLLGEAPPRYRSGNHATFTGFTAVGDSSQYSRIDYIFGGSNGGWTPNAYHVGSNLYDDGVYASDHRPVYADLTLA